MAELRTCKCECLLLAVKKSGFYCKDKQAINLINYLDYLERNGGGGATNKSTVASAGTEII